MPIAKRATILIIALCGSFLLQGCLFSEDSEKKTEKRIHLMNPWPGELGNPFIHGDQINNWKTSPMEQEDACGWFVYKTPLEEPGNFRFLRAGRYNDPAFSFGNLGVGSERNFMLNGFFKESDDVWIYPTEGGGAAWSVEQPVIPGCEGGATVPKPAPGNATYAFPQETGYGRGLLPSFSSWTDVQQLFNLWKNAHYEVSGSMARVKFDDPAYTVSEGIAYGMLIFVYMDNAENNTRGDFDKLWAYYQNFANANGLMHWKIQGFSSVVETGAATDSDLDAALALLLAWKQWQDDSYLSAALQLIAAIKAHEMDANGLILPGDAWDYVTNPSYFSWAALQCFAAVDAANATFWNAAVSVNYQHALSARHGSTGLVPNWTNLDGTPGDPGTGYDNPESFGFDAVRMPWRAAWAWLWYGHAEGADLAGKISSWIAGATAGDPLAIRSPYSLNGTPLDTYTAGPAFTGAFGAAAMTTDQQAWLDAVYSQLKSQTSQFDQTYYHSSLQVLYALLITGNMPNMLAP